MKNKLKRMQLVLRNFHKKGIIFGAVFTLTLLGLSVFIPKMSTHANDPETVVVHTYFLGEGGTYSAQYTPVASEEADQVGEDKTGSGFFTVASGEQISFTAAPIEGYRFKGWYLTNADQTCSLVEPITCELLTTNYTLTVTPEGYPYYAPLFEEEEPQPSGNPVQSTEDIEFEITWTGTFVNAWINDKSVMEESSDYQNLNYHYEGVIVANAGTTDPNGTNVLRFQNRFGDSPVNEYVINGMLYEEDNPNIEIRDDGWYITVAGADKYVIEGSGDSSASVARTIIWANVDANTNADDYEEDMRLEHGRAKVIAIYDGETQVAGETDVDENGMGWVVVTPGNEVVFEFVPEYGYQLTSVEANGLPLEPQETINQYTFTMPDTNIHFAATFERVKDTVETNSSKVKRGSISLGGALDSGSAQLTVNDIELSSDKIAGFEGAAGEYAISSYLDIDLYNIFYKANSEDEDDVWTDKIDELEKEVTITIQLEEGIDGNDIVIVHNIHDGEEYEIIQIDSYDPDTNTITFKTKSFSGYAIAERTTAAPNSGLFVIDEDFVADQITLSIIIAICAVVIFAIKKDKARTTR